VGQARRMVMFNCVTANGDFAGADCKRRVA
jgi:hypothetical protein